MRMRFKVALISVGFQYERTGFHSRVVVVIFTCRFDFNRIKNLVPT